MRVIVREANEAPALLGVEVDGSVITLASSNTPIAATEGVPLSVEIFGYDSDLDHINWHVVGLPNGMSLDTQSGSAGSGSLQLNWTPGFYAAQSDNLGGAQPGHYHVTVTGSDGAGQISHTFDIAVANTNQAPRILPMPLQLISEGELLNFRILGGDPDGNAVKYALLHDQNTPDNVYFDPINGEFEWRPSGSFVDNLTDTDRALTFTFEVSDGIATTQQTVQVRVFDVNRQPVLSVSNHAMLVGQSFSLPVTLGTSENSAGIVASDTDGQAQTQSLVVSFIGLPDGAQYDAQTQQLNWVPGPGQVGDYVIAANISDGLNTSTKTFTLRVVAEAQANAPKILVSTTPSTPAQPGQTIVATVRAQSYSPIQTLAVQIRGSALSDAAQWQTVALDSLGRLHLVPTDPGLIEIQVTAIDQDGFSSTHTQTVSVKDISDTQAPALAWSGLLQGADRFSEPLIVSDISNIQAALQEQQLMGYKLEIAPANTAQWRILTERSHAADEVLANLSLTTLDPSTLHNGVYTLRLAAWDLVGRTTEIEANIVIDTEIKNIEIQTATDHLYTLGGHDLALTRLLEAGSPAIANDIGNWQIPLLSTQLTHDQPSHTDLGTVAPWQEGAQLWLQIPSSPSVPDAELMILSFTLSTTQEQIGRAHV